ncbi:hypothetical protein ITJ44_07990 [Clavibacter sp. VKM Ac-2873]|uniref:YobI family P-loop NTPase n=1 Tax=Clavibacter sp. VKM Ac-2873 TaxID=2783813 RepID=UPI00188C05F1|nr:hypothetical protein [Clavibacter sp. VKM Ac-2873]MBF4618012.1 hypothetical protein [Clavibacter sp. VKM Ac-2873]
MAKERDERPRNIALSGPYGSGKSSVLALAGESWDQRYINISLSALSNVVAHSTDVDKNSAPDTTRFLQKEIVKQLLYREAPRAVPDSRFKRIEPTSVGKTMFVGALVTFLAFAVSVLFDLATTFANRLFDGNVSSGACFLFMVLLGTGVAGGSIYTAITRRFDIKSLSAAGAGITLGDRSASYFDKYLDEIMYFFEKTRVNIVVLEDLDRFNDIHIFESLRALNGLLNNSRQLKEPVQFIYAIRDGIFAKARDASGADVYSDALGARTKFFDLIVPLVPFITTDTSADLLKEVLRGVTHPPSSRLLQIVGPYVPDMRLVHNIRNEYEVFAAELLDAAPDLGGLQADTLFAMVAYKNLAPQQFEQIRRHNSELNFFFDSISDGIKHETRLIRAQIRDLQSAIASNEFTDQEADSLGVRLEQVLPVLHKVQYHMSAELQFVTLMPSGAVREAGSLHDPATWTSITTAESMHVQYANSRSTTISIGDLEELLGGEKSFTSIGARSSRTMKSEIEALETRLEILNKNRLPMMMRDSNFKLPYKSDRLAIADILTDTVVAQTGLVADLLADGVLDANFALYSAKYYGVTLAANAMTFVINNLQPRVPDPSYKFTTDDEVDALILEYGESLFTTTVGLNYDLVSRLCSTGSKHLGSVVEFLAHSASDSERAFIREFVELSEQRYVFYQRLAGTWIGALEYLLSIKGLDSAFHLSLMDATLRALPEAQDIQVDGSEVLETFLDEFVNLPLYKLDLGAEQTVVVAKQVAILGALHPRIGLLVPRMKAANVDLGSWVINVDNLKSLGSSPAFATLPWLHSQIGGVFAYVLENLHSYLEASVAEDAYVVVQGEDLAPVINVVTANKPDFLNAVIDRISPDTMYGQLEPIVKLAWPRLMAKAVIEPSSSNLLAYMNDYGFVIDDSLAMSLSVSDIVSVNELDIRVVIAVINSSLLTDIRKVELLEPAVLADIEIKDVEPNGKALIAAHLGQWFNDDATTLMHAFSLDRAIGVKVAAASERFKSYVADVALTDSHVAAILATKDVSTAKGSALIAVLMRAKATHVTAAAAVGWYDRFGRTPSIAALKWLSPVKKVRPSLVRMLVVGLTHYGEEEVLEVLGMLGDVYAELLSKGPAVHVPKDDIHRRLISYLESINGPVSNTRDAKKWITVWRAGKVR